MSLLQAATLARRTDPQLTARVYAKLGVTGERKALAKLPSLTENPDPAALRATGTNGERFGTQALLTLRPNGPKVSASDSNENEAGGTVGERKLLQLAGIGEPDATCPQGFSKPPPGFEPGTCALQKRCSTS